eukprot:m.45010 g.45010  ORF g.45010 m.45010 type:complete len:105 (+) comp33559_c0_seq3:666-980(+)
MRLCLFFTSIQVQKLEHRAKVDVYFVTSPLPVQWSTGAFEISCFQLDSSYVGWDLPSYILVGFTHVLALHSSWHKRSTQLHHLTFNHFPNICLRLEEEFSLSTW